MEDFGRRLILLLGLALLPSCANPIQRGKALYVEGRLVEAAEVFEHGEDNLATLNSQECIRYGLYRGATLLKLGDLDGAARWLYFAQQAESHHPGSIELSDVQMLRLAFKDLDRRRLLVKPSLDPLKGAVARANGGEVLGPDVAQPVESSAATRTTAPLPLSRDLPKDPP
ncbi:MAG TPA: hypothetical protein VKP30_10760 [Polyangiaceae bacterium]|nr:hypothetical protein [Polyangiaceae bacterium]